MLKIVNIKGKKFEMLDKKGYFIGSGYSLLETSNNKYIGFTRSNGIPYTPVGGKKALHEIISAGGFVGFDGMIYLDEMEA